MTGGGVVNLLLGSICDLVFVICGIESDQEVVSFLLLVVALVPQLCNLLSQLNQKP